jgi:hypothetical protein
LLWLCSIVWSWVLWYLKRVALFCSVLPWLFYSWSIVLLNEL